MSIASIGYSKHVLKVKIKRQTGTSNWFFCFILRKHFSARLRGFSVSLIAYVGSRWQFTVHVSRLSRWRRWRRRRRSAARLSGAWLPIASTLHNSIRNCLSLMCVVGWKFSSWREDDHFQQWLLCKPRTSTDFFSIVRPHNNTMERHKYFSPKLKKIEMRSIL